MDRYKRKPIKCNRDLRQAETLKARESSRFKRLSILRSMNETSEIEDKSMEPDKSTECTKGKPLSRFEMLCKWKREKELKKELEKKKFKKPFYAGSSQPLKDGFCKVSYQKLTLGTSIQPAKIANNSKMIGAKILNTVNSTSANKSTKSFDNSTISSKSQGSSFSKSASTKILSRPPQKGSSLPKSVSTKIPSGPPQKASSLPKPASTKIPSGPPHKIGIPKPQTSIPACVPKRIPIKKAQSEKAVSRINQRPVVAAAACNIQKETSRSLANVTTRKGFCFKKAAAKEQSGNVKFAANSKEKVEEKNKLKVPEQCLEAESVTEQSLEDIPDLTFNCNISLIKRPSFAPDNFKFQPPDGLGDFLFDDDLGINLEKIKLKFLSRTSTPTKPKRPSSFGSENSNGSSDNSPLVNKANLSQNELDKLSCSDEKVLNVISTESQLKREMLNNEIQDKTDKKLVIEIPVIEKTNEPDMPNEPVVNECIQNISDVCIDSPLDTVDLNKLKKHLNFCLEDDNDETLVEQNTVNYIEKKPTGAVPKRVSMLRNKSYLNSISESDEFCAQSNVPASNKNSIVTSQQSKRLSNSTPHTPKPLNGLNKITINEESPISAITVTPRRSLRLHDIKAKNCQFDAVLSPFEKRKPRVGIRRSMRLIDLNTPEKDVNVPCHTNITADFGKLTLKESCENMDPNLLIDFDNSPIHGIKAKSKKISLLYSPEKRKSIRKSIKDLMSFSPCN